MIEGITQEDDEGCLSCEREMTLCIHHDTRVPFTKCSWHRLHKSIELKAIGIDCPKCGSKYHNTWPMRPILGKDPSSREPLIMVVKCQRCGFEAWASKSLRDKYGEPMQPYVQEREVFIDDRRL